MSERTDGRGLSLMDGLRPFRNQGWRLQAAVVAGGVLAWVGTYGLVMTVTGWDALASADSLAAIHARRNAAAVAGAAAGLAFAALWTRAYGGPLLNVLYLIGVETLMPARVYALGGTPPESVLSQAGPLFGLFLTNPTWVWDHAVAALPGVVVFGVVLTAWLRSLSPDEERAFAENHLPDAWLALRKE